VRYTTLRFLKKSIKREQEEQSILLIISPLPHETISPWHFPCSHSFLFWIVLNEKSMHIVYRWADSHAFSC